MRWIACILLTAHLFGQRPENLLERIRNSPLPPEQREVLAKAFAAKDFAAMEQILARFPDLQALTGAVEFLRGRMDRAAAAFRHADKLNPLSDPDRFTWAMALVDVGDGHAAREQLEHLAASHPTTPLYLYWLARIDYNERRYEDAIERFRRVIQLDPTSARPYDNLGLALDMSGQPEEARQVFLKAVELNRQLPQPSPWPPHNLGYLLVRLLDFRNAEKALRESLQYDPRFALAHYHLGRALEGDGRDREAIEEYRMAVSFDPNLVEALYSLGLLYRRQGRAADAEAAFADYKRLKTKLVDSH